MSSYIGPDIHAIQRSIVNHVEYTLGLTRFNFDDFGAYQAAAFSVRDRMIEAWNDTNEYFTVSLMSLLGSALAGCTRDSAALPLCVSYFPPPRI